MTVKLPYIKWRDGRPRLVHGPRERAAALPIAICAIRRSDGRRLVHLRTGRSFADEHHQKIVAARASGKRIKPPSTRGRHRRGSARRLAGIAEVPTSSRRRSRPIARRCARVISSRRAATDAPSAASASARRRARRQRIPEREREPIARSRRRDRRAGAARLFNYLKGARGHHMALAAIAALSAALHLGPRELEVAAGAQSAHRHGVRSAGRPRRHDRARGVQRAGRRGRCHGPASIGDAIYLGLFTGQRQTDRLALKDEGLVDGRRHFRQSKTGALVAIKETPQLAARLAQARVRVAELKMKLGLRDMPERSWSTRPPAGPTTSTPIGICSPRSARWRSRAATSDVAPCPSLAFINENAARRLQARSGSARHLRDAARSRRQRPAVDLRRHRPQLPVGAADHEALPRPQRRARRCRDRQAGRVHCRTVSHESGLFTVRFG
jgi:hypothetical protein